MNRFLDQAVNSTDWHIREAIAGKCIKSALCLRNDDSAEVRKRQTTFSTRICQRCASTPCSGSRDTTKTNKQHWERGQLPPFFFVVA